MNAENIRNKESASLVKAVFFCPLVGNIDEGDGDMFTVGDSYLADSAYEIAEALEEYSADYKNNMAVYYSRNDSIQKMNYRTATICRTGMTR